MLHSVSTPVYYYLNTNIINNDRIIQKIKIAGNLVYSVLNYDKHLLCFNDYMNGLYRSVIYTYPEKTILSFSPPKMTDINSFMQRHPSIDNHILVNEMITGIMIHLFYDYRIQKWQLASKKSVGCNYCHHSNDTPDCDTVKTYYRMFLDALSAMPEQNLNDIALLELLQKDISYTFILQHPENNILVPIDNPTIYLISAYRIFPLLNCVEYIPATIYETWPEFKNIEGIVKFPKQYNNITEYNEIMELQSIQVRGFVFTNIQTGERTVIESANYNRYMKIKSILPNIQYQYLCLRRINKIKEYLVEYPAYKKKFYKMRDIYNDFIYDVYKSYMNYYVHKNTSVIDDKYYTHIYKIHHNIYLPSLNLNQRKNKSTAVGQILNGVQKVIIKRTVVMQYFDKMEPRELLYLLNYDESSASAPFSTNSGSGTSRSHCEA